MLTEQDHLTIRDNFRVPTDTEIRNIVKANESNSARAAECDKPNQTFLPEGIVQILSTWSYGSPADPSEP